MHILLTDVLTCPRCGPRFGLVLLADQMVDRRVVSGRLGCPNCREAYAIRDGTVDLRLEPASDAEEPAPPRGPEWVERLGALLGVTQGPGSLLLVGAAGQDARDVAALLPFVEVVTAGAIVGSATVLAGERLPFRDRAFRGLALLDGRTPPERLAEAARLLGPGARLVVDPAPAGTASEAARHGLRPLLDQEGVVVASAP